MSLLRAIYNEVGKEGVFSASLQSRLLRRGKFDAVGLTYCVRVEDVDECVMIKTRLDYELGLTFILDPPWDSSCPIKPPWSPSNPRTWHQKAEQNTHVEQFKVGCEKGRGAICPNPD